MQKEYNKNTLIDGNTWDAANKKERFSYFRLFFNNLLVQLFMSSPLHKFTYTTVLNKLLKKTPNLYSYACYIK